MIIQLSFFLLTKLIPLGIAFVIFYWLRENGSKKLGISIFALTIAWALFSSYTDFRPLKYYYKNTFTNHTGIPFPASGEIIYTYYTYPDLEDEYIVTTLFQTNQQDFDAILKTIKENPYFDHDTAQFKFRLDEEGREFHEKDFTERYTIIQRQNLSVFTVSFNPKLRLIHYNRNNW